MDHKEYGNEENDDMCKLKDHNEIMTELVELIYHEEGKAQKSQNHQLFVHFTDHLQYNIYVGILCV